MIKLRFITVIAAVLLLFSCSEKTNKKPLSKKIERPRIIVTTKLLEDCAVNIGHNFINVSTITKNENIPYIFNVSEYNVFDIKNADIIFYTGLSYEGRLQNIITKKGKPDVYAASSGYDKQDIIKDRKNNGKLNPYFWLDVKKWMKTVYFVTDILIEENPENELTYVRSEDNYIKELRRLDEYIVKETEKIPPENRIIITESSAFDYFGRAYGFKTESLYGTGDNHSLSARDINELSNFIIDNNIKIIFSESSAPKTNMAALKRNLSSKGYDIYIGGILHTDVTGKKEAENYIKMMKSNIDTIVKALADNNG